MSAFHNNLALHISDATLKAHRRLDAPERPRPLYLLLAVIGAAAIWAAAAALI